MKKVLALDLAFVFLLFFWGCATGESLQGASVAITEQPPIYWQYGWTCAQRERAIDSYGQVEIDGSDFITSSEGSSVTGYYESKELRIIEVTVFQSRHQEILRFYPLDDVVVIIGKTIKYASDKPLAEITEDDFCLEAVLQAVIKDGQVYLYIDERAPMYLSDLTQYAEIYAKAAGALGDIPADLLANPAAQDAAIELYHQTLWRYLTNYGMADYIGQEYQGVEITASGLIAGAHLVGARGLRDAIRDGREITDANGTTAQHYMELFGGYDIPWIN